MKVLCAHFLAGVFLLVGEKWKTGRNVTAKERADCHLIVL